MSASWALLVEAAKDRRAWLESYVALGDRAMSPSREWSTTPVPTAFVIPKQKQDPQALQRLIWTLQHGQVEVRESTGPIAVGSATYPAGSYVISTTQPYGGYAKALLERQKYPDLREYPGGPPKRPYDVTAHTLPLLFGVAVAAYTGAEPSVTAPVAAVAEPMYSVPELSRKAGIPRIAIYRSFASTMDEGWTRWMFDAYGVAFTSITDKEVRGGNLGARFDVVIIPDQNARQIAGGLGAAFPDSLRGGLGEPGAQAFAAFVRGGGTLLAFNGASDYAIDALKLPVKNVLAGVRNTEFYAPGSLLSVELMKGHLATVNVTAPVPAIWFENSPAFEITDPSQTTAIATYQAKGDPLLSGWLLGGAKLNGKAAMVESVMGTGRVYLYGFRPQYRGQSMATQPLIWYAMLRGKI